MVISIWYVEVSGLLLGGNKLVSLFLSVLISFESLLFGPGGNDPLETTDTRTTFLQVLHYLLIHPNE